MIELIIVVAMIAILAVIIYVAVDPVRRIHSSNNATRAANVNAILNAYLNYIADNKGGTPFGTSAATRYMIGTGAGAGSCTAAATSAHLDMSVGLVDRYIASIPKDPVNGTDSDTLYYFYRSSTDRVTIGACGPEAEGGTTPEIIVTR